MYLGVPVYLYIFLEIVKFVSDPLTVQNFNHQNHDNFVSLQVFPKLT